MNNKIMATIKSKTDILKSLNNIELVGNTTYANLNDNPKLGQINIPNLLWSVCEKTIELSNVQTETHQFDYRYFDMPTQGETTINILYFMKNWIDIQTNNEGDK
jgi:hypothetical protein